MGRGLKITKLMAALIKGRIAQMRPEGAGLVWDRPRAWSGNEIKYTALSAIDAPLDTSRFHISIPLKGREPYWVDGEAFSAGEGDYFIFNPEQSARAEGRFATVTEGHCIFLTEATVQEAAQSLSGSLSAALDSPFHFSWQQHAFLVKTYRLEENAFGQYLQGLQQLLLGDAGQLVDWDAFYLDLAQAFLQTHRQIGREVAAIPATQAATRQEAYRRITIAHAYIQENFTQPFSLDQLSLEACLSKSHLLRLYRAVYGKTPYQAVLQLRIARAQELLLADYSPTAVAALLSFSDRRAFAKVFKKWVGEAPSVFAAKSRKG